jgi:hypothetical protein
VSVQPASYMHGLSDVNVGMKSINVNTPQDMTNSIKNFITLAQSTFLNHRNVLILSLSRSAVLLFELYYKLLLSLSIATTLSNWWQLASEPHFPGTVLLVVCNKFQVPGNRLSRGTDKLNLRD